MPQKPQSLLGKFLIWRVRNIPQRQFILLLSVLVGLLSGGVAVLLKNSVHVIQHLLTDGFAADWHRLFYFAFPVVGILITALLIRYVIRNPIGDGIPSTLYAISKKNGIIPAFKTWASVVTSTFTVGFGGSVGLEGPTVSTGSAIGSNLARMMHLNYRQRILLISCATAGALSSILNAPITALVFAIEIFSLDLTMASMVPLLLASVSGAVTSIFFTGNDYLFRFEITEGFAVGDLPYYVLLSLVAALASIYFNRVYFAVEGAFERVKSRWTRVLVGGSLLGLLIYLIPPLYGEGYETINNLLNGNVAAVLHNSALAHLGEDPYLLLLLLLGLVLFKVFATSFTFGAGGVGGIFAPTLFMGSALGFVFARTVNLFKLGQVNESNFSLVGMAALMAGILHAPLTAIFLIAEVTGGYELFLPLMLAAALTFAVVKAFVPNSVYTLQLAKRGELITHDKDRAVLTLMKVDEVVETDFNPIEGSQTLGQLVEVVSRSKRNLFPVLDEDGALEGVLTLDDFRQIMFDRSLYETTRVEDLMNAPPAIIQPGESMEDVLQKFQATGAWNLPVVENGKYVGFVSKSKLFSAYRRKLIEFSGE